MNDLDDELAGVFTHLAGDAPHRPDLAATARRRARRQRAGEGAALAVTAVAAGLLLVPQVVPGPENDAPPVAVAPACESTVNREVLPDWARAGFSDPEPVMPFVRSTGGNIVAVLFGERLSSPPRPDVSNKVLWVWRDLPDVTSIKAVARLDGTGPAVTAGLPTPAGPSSVDLPAPGCWRLTLTWAGGRDTIDLRAVGP